jgi:uncharacterized protein (TIGR03000 family)
MYSIVMMTALAATPDAPQFNGYFRDLFSRSNSNNCAGCNGCSGATRYSCFGGCSGAAAYPASCSGCTGCNGCNGHVFGLGERVRSWFSRDTSGYGCCGGQSYSCMGSSYSCSGFAHSCFGAPTSYTPMFNGGLSCQGGLPMTAPAPMFDPMPIPGMPGGPFAVPDPAPGNVGLRPAGHASPSGALASSGSVARASVVVKLPADARLFVDARALTLTGAERKFVSPELPTDQEFVYRFRAEYERNGETLSVTKKVPVRAGATVTVEFADLTAARPAETPVVPATKEKEVPAKPTAREPAKIEPPVAPATEAPTLPGGDRATITVKLPPGATLYVDDRKSPSQEPTRSFTTPVLPAGREFAYLLKVETVRNGHPETLTQKVPFRAGERITVDFSTLGK